MWSTSLSKISLNCCCGLYIQPQNNFTFSRFHYSSCHCSPRDRLNSLVKVIIGTKTKCISSYDFWNISRRKIIASLLTFTDRRQPHVNYFRLLSVFMHIDISIYKLVRYLNNFVPKKKIST